MPDTPTGTVDLVVLAQNVYDGVAADPVAYATQAAALVEWARREGPPEALVVGLRAQAWAHRLATHNAKALRLLDEAVRLAERHTLDQRLGEVLVSRVAVHQELGHLAAAQRDADRAAALLPPAQRAQQVFLQGVILQNTGQLPSAATHYRQLLADADCPALTRAKAGNNLAHLEAELGHTDVARELLEDAAAVAAIAGPTVAAYVAQTRAGVEVQAGRLAESLVRFEEAGRAFAAAGLPLGTHYVGYAEAFAHLRLLPEALDAARRGVAALPEAEVSLMAAEAQLSVARLALLAGDLPTALAAAQAGAASMRRQRRPGWLERAVLLTLLIRAQAHQLSVRELSRLRRCADALESHGMRTDAVEALLLLGRLSAAGSADRASALSRADHPTRRAPVLLRLRGRLAAALLAESSADVRAVVATCRAGLRDLDQHRRALPTMELRALASAHGAELGAVGLRALLRDAAACSPAAVFSWLERTRAIAVAPSGAEPVSGPELVELRTAQAELAAAVGAGEAEPVALLARIAAAEAAVRRASWLSSAAPSSASGTAEPADARSGPPTAAQVRPALAAHDAVLVEYAELDGRLLAVVLDRRRTRILELGPTDGLAATVDSLLFALRRLARPDSRGLAAQGARRSAEAALSALRARLVEPMGLAEGRPVVVVPVGVLQRVPWAPLCAGPVTVAPSAAVWLRTLQPAGAGRVLLVGGPGLDNAGAELAALHSIHATATVMGPDASTCAAVVDALASADLVHFACHGRLRADNPTFSSLLLADGPLTVHELSIRAGAPGRVVLAACESGAQVAFPGDEALGFVAALLAAGSRGVVASGVLVSDEQTLPLMQALHRRLATGATVADALWDARSHLDPADPAQLASWCAFDAYGGG